MAATPNSIINPLYKLRLLSKSSTNSSICFLHKRLQSSVADRMRCWQINDFGGSEKLQLKDNVKISPLHSPKDVLVKVHASSVNPIDIQLMGGYGRGMFSMMRRIQDRETKELVFPVTLGRDFSGVLVQKGAGVKGFKVGDEIWGCIPAYNKSGCHAEYVVVPESMMSLKPSSISHIEAASIPYAAVTAWGAICTAGGLNKNNTKGKRVLVYGGSGGVGTISVQLLAAWGAEVSTTCNTDAVKMMYALGAHNVIDYKENNFRDQLFQIRGFDVIIDAVYKERSSFNMGLLRSGVNAKYVTIVTPMVNNADENGLLVGGFKSAMTLSKYIIRGLPELKQYKWAFAVPDSKPLKYIAGLVDKNQIMPFVEKTYSFEDTPRAFDKVKAGHNRGKTVIDVIGSQSSEVDRANKNSDSSNS